MSARGLKILLGDGETPATIRAALEALAEIPIPHSKAAEGIKRLRAELQQELRTLEPQGSLL